jgi:hypothetical protein
VAQLESLGITENQYEINRQHGDTPRHQVTETSPAAGEDISKIIYDKTGGITLDVSSGVKITMQDLVGLKKDEAIKELTDLGEDENKIHVIEDYSGKEKGLVYATNPSKGTDISDEIYDGKSGITVSVSKGTFAERDELKRKKAAEELAKKKKRAIYVSYNDLLRNPSKYSSTLVKIKCKVTDSKPETFLGFQYDTSLFCTYEGQEMLITDGRDKQEPFLQVGDYVTLYGYSDGNVTMQVKQKEYQGGLLFGFSYNKVVDSYDIPNFRYIIAELN